MANISLVKFKVRRGTDAERQTITLDQGEMGYTTDLKRLFIGNGETVGGIAISTKILNNVANSNDLINIPSAVEDDLCRAGGTVYHLNGADGSQLNNWQKFGSIADGNTIGYTSEEYLKINEGGITASHLSPLISGDGLVINGSALNVDADPLIFGFHPSTDKLTINNAGISVNQIDKNTFGAGIVGGYTVGAVSIYASDYFDFDSAGTRLTLATGGIDESLLSPSIWGAGLEVVVPGGPASLDINTSQFTLVNNELNIIGTSPPAGSVGFDEIDQSVWGSHLIPDNTNKKVDVDISSIVDEESIIYNGSNLISINNNLDADMRKYAHEGATTGSTSYGTAQYQGSSMLGALTGIGWNGAASAENIFNGSPDQNIRNYDSGDPHSSMLYQTANLAGQTVMLTSAGFITFSGNVKGRDDDAYIGSYAIPIFSLPDDYVTDPLGLEKLSAAGIPIDDMIKYQPPALSSLSGTLYENTGDVVYDKNSMYPEL